MNQQYKKLWLEALRSGKYEQINNELSNDDGFCCLGVLCKITGLAYEEDMSFLPEDIMFVAGLNKGNPLVVYNGETRGLAYFNDHKNLTFAQIADLIEEQL